MSHATDGELHAYLDGALASIDPVRADRLKTHLEGCSDCTARLEDTRTLRARAGEILADAEPELVQMPPFEAILERQAKGSESPSHADAPTPIRIRRSRPPLAWAASVAVALGAGWLGHGVWSGTPSTDGMARLPLTQTPAVADPQGSESGESATRALNLGLVEDEGGGRSSEVEELAAAGSLDRITVTGEPDDAPGVSGRRADPKSQVRLEDRVDERADQQEADAAPVTVSELERGAGGRENQPPPPADDARARGIAEAEEGNETERALQKTAQDAPVERRFANREAAADVRQEGAGRAVAGAPGDYFRDAGALDARFLGEQVTWLPVSRTDAEHWIGGRVPVVPDLAPAELAISKLDETRLVRIHQTLPGGERLELIQEALKTDDEVQVREVPSAAPAARAGLDSEADQAAGVLLVIERDGFRITANAPVAADSLQILLSKLR